MTSINDFRYSEVADLIAHHSGSSGDASFPPRPELSGPGDPPAYRIFLHASTPPHFNSTQMNQIIIYMPRRSLETSPLWRVWRRGAGFGRPLGALQVAVLVHSLLRYYQKTFVSGHRRFMARVKTHGTFTSWYLVPPTPRNAPCLARRSYS